MKYNKDKFMSIGGYCLNLWVLGKNRIRGPIDNVLMISAETIKLLLENKYYSYLKHHTPCKMPRKDLPERYCFQYDNLVQIYHNNVYSEKFKPELKKRVNNLNKFYKNLLTNKDYYFVFCIPHTWVDINNGELKNNELEKCILYFKQYNILDKIIFIGNRQAISIKPNMWYNTYLNTDVLDYFIENYQIKYLELSDTIIEKNNNKKIEEIHKQFIKKLKNLK